MEGELAIEKDTRKFKIGDGKLNWNDLPYATQGETGKAIEYDWDGTRLGIRIEGNTDYTYQDLQGAKGEPFKFEDFTEEQLALLKGDSGDVGYTAGEGIEIDRFNKISASIDVSDKLNKAGDTLGSYTEQLVITPGRIDLSQGNVFYRVASNHTSFSIVNTKQPAHSFTLIIDMADVKNISFPTSVKWQGGEIPDLTEPNKTYVLTFMTIDSGVTWLGMFGGEF